MDNLVAVTEDAAIAGLEKKSFAGADETRDVDHATLELVHLGGLTLTRGTLQPGWRWSRHVKPTAGTASCEVRHQGVVLFGQLHVEMDDGTSGDAEPGDAYVIEPGHDAWVVGDQPVVFVDFSPAMEGYGKRSGAVE